MTYKPDSIEGVKAVDFPDYVFQELGKIGAAIEELKKIAPVVTPALPAIDPADILASVSADLPFAQQKGCTLQALGKYTPIEQIPETGVHGTKLADSSTLRFGKVPDPLNPARKVLSFMVAPTDPFTAGDGKRRSELSYGKNIPMETPYWCAFSAYLYAWGVDQTLGLFGAQIHSGDNTRGLSPAWQFFYRGDLDPKEFRVRSTHSLNSAPSQSNSIPTEHGDHPLPFGIWRDFVLQAKQSTKATGFFRLWLDGVQVVNYSGNIGFNTPGHMDYQKFGIYISQPFSTPRRLLLRNPITVFDPSGKYSPAILRAFVNKE